VIVGIGHKRVLPRVMAAPTQEAVWAAWRLSVAEYGHQDAVVRAPHRMLPASMKGPLADHLNRVKVQHDADLAAGRGRQLPAIEIFISRLTFTSRST
jgi:hypothetical protein